MPLFNPPAWTYSEGGLWPWYYYIYHDLLGLDKPLTAFFGDWAMGAPLLWILGGVVLVGFMAGFLYATVKARSWKWWKVLAFAPGALCVGLWAHTLERILHYTLIAGVK